MLHPTQPARRAVGESGGRFSIADSVKKNDGTNRRLRTVQSVEYCMTSRFGVASARIAAIMAP
jgi:hypothetical protein